jgi:hypothetical protein
VERVGGREAGEEKREGRKRGGGLARVAVIDDFFFFLFEMPSPNFFSPFSQSSHPQDGRVIVRIHDRLDESGRRGREVVSAAAAAEGSPGGRAGEREAHRSRWSKLFSRSARKFFVCVKGGVFRLLPSEFERKQKKKKKKTPIQLSTRLWTSRCPRCPGGSACGCSRTSGMSSES